MPKRRQHDERGRTSTRALPTIWPLIWLVACSSGGDGLERAQIQAPTYYGDVKPILDASCVACHEQGGIAPFALDEFADVVSKRSAIVASATTRHMPPWPPASGCSEYKGERALPDAQIAMLADWAMSGAAAGDPRDYVPAPASTTSLSRVDRVLSMPEPYTPRAAEEDEYRCLLFDWPASSEEFVTGWRLVPGNRALVHHAIVFIGAPRDASLYASYDAMHPGPGYPCFGGTSAAGVTTGGPASLLSVWTPGQLGENFPESTGVRIEPGSVLILQMHYSTLSGSREPDQTKVELKIDQTVEKPAYVIPIANADWLRNKTMHIPAGDPDVVHSHRANPMVAAAARSGGALGGDRPIMLHSAMLHMHLLGTKARVSIIGADSAETCLLDVPDWDFAWQGMYYFTTPKRVHPGDQLYLECHWDNSGARAIKHHGSGDPLPARDTNWGESTTDEMCAAFLYATE